MKLQSKFSESDYEALLDSLREIHPDLEILDKAESRLMKWIDAALKTITFGKFTDFMTMYATTIGSTIYVPSGWTQSPPLYRALILRHEAVHLRQFKDYGVPLFALLYLALPLPLFYAYYRTKFEMEAYAETLRAEWEIRGSGVAGDVKLRQFIIEQFTGPSYGWSWVHPHRVEEWYDSVLQGLQRGDEGDGSIDEQ